VIVWAEEVVYQNRLAWIWGKPKENLKGKMMYNQTAHPHGYAKGTWLKRKERKGKKMEHFGK